MGLRYRLQQRAFAAGTRRVDDNDVRPDAALDPLGQQLLGAALEEARVLDAACARIVPGILHRLGNDLDALLDS
ncbi:hypothetical protein [Paenibacillus sp. OSY-SE]|uniref:hypothetical protein n=1 Tax=Paenibacillus sp. OSY-SE TaxID=1196323 RepID=UPI000307D3DB|nr:hypothetical protein [Paenibacillus sp. OSY-SE]